jgi:DNA-binding MarR family transcriptional regulator
MTRSDQQICDDLIMLLNRTKSAAVQLAEEEGLTRMQLFALYSVAHSGGLAMGQVADVLQCDASNVTGIVDRMVAQDLVIRTESARDRRAKTIQLTAKGEKVVAQLSSLLPTKLGCDRLNDEERQSLHGIIQKLCN